MNDSRFETQPIDLRAGGEPEGHEWEGLRPTSRRRSPSHVRLIIGVMVLAGLAVLGTRLAGVLLAAGPTG